jgi:hypothetical protein
VPVSFSMAVLNRTSQNVGRMYATIGA